MDFKTTIAEPKNVTIDGKEYIAKVLNCQDLSDLSNMIFAKETKINSDAKKLSLYETQVDLAFQNPHLALWASIYKSDPTIEFDKVTSLPLVNNEEAFELIAHLVGLPIKKK